MYAPHQGHFEYARSDTLLYLLTSMIPERMNSYDYRYRGGLGCHALLSNGCIARRPLDLPLGAKLSRRPSWYGFGWLCQKGRSCGPCESKLPSGSQPDSHLTSASRAEDHAIVPFMAFKTAKQMKDCREPGVYMYTANLNGVPAVYVGVSCCIAERWKGHGSNSVNRKIAAAKNQNKAFADWPAWAAWTAPTHIGTMKTPMALIFHVEHLLNAAVYATHAAQGLIVNLLDNGAASYKLSPVEAMEIWDKARQEGLRIGAVGATSGVAFMLTFPRQAVNPTRSQRWYSKMAEEYGVVELTIDNVVRGHSWAPITRWLDPLPMAYYRDCPTRMPQWLQEDADKAANKEPVGERQARVFKGHTKRVFEASAPIASWLFELG